MECYQFHPTGMVWPHSVRGILVTESVRGDGGVLRNSSGRRFMREVRKRRPAVERAFLAAVTRGIADFASQQRASANPTAGVPLPIGTVELTLVADNELEESLAITSMIGKNETRLTRDLFAVNQRLSVIYGGIRVEDANNPVAPASLTQAFRLAMRELSAEMRVKLIIFKLFDRYVLAALDELYQEINTELVRAGVLPQLRHEVQRSGGAASSGTAAAAAAQGAAQIGDVPLADDAASGELLQTLRTLFSARRGGMPQDLAADPPSKATPPYPRETSPQRIVENDNRVDSWP